MKITHPLLTKSLGLLGATVIRALAATLDYRIVYQDPLADPIHPRNRRRGIYVLWHEYMLLPVGVRGKGLTVLVSQHRDGELITQVLRHLKFQSIRGSTTRGGVAALRGIMRGGEGERGRGRDGPGRAKTEGNIRQNSNFEFRISKLPSRPLAGSLILTPDGPRGPRRHLAEGAIFLASRLRMPIVCMGFGFDRPWRQNSWDRFAIPRPFSRARAVISSYMEIPADLSKQARRQGDTETRRLEDAGSDFSPHLPFSLSP
jgi:lysophospholipid acyltransferase (LPLAT)-like uncharacterized protein